MGVPFYARNPKALIEALHSGRKRGAAYHANGADAPPISDGARLIRHVGRRAVTQIRQVQDDWLQWEATFAQHSQEN